MMLDEAGIAGAEITTAASFANILRRVPTAPIWLPMRALGGGRC